MSCELLNRAQIRAVNRMGDIMCPRFENFPSFTELDVVAHADDVLRELPEADLKDLKLLLTVLSFLPKPILSFVLCTIDRLQNIGGPIGPTLRMIRFGLRGVIFSLYYSGLKGPRASANVTSHQVIGYQVHVAPLAQK
jgi:hypothetical protein